MQINNFSTTLGEEAINQAVECLKTSKMGFGANVACFEEQFSFFSRKVFNTGLNSASSAAFVLFDYLYGKYGECEVYTPSLGFVSSYWAAKKTGHSLVFVDVDEDFLFDVKDYLRKRKDNQKRKVLMPILYGGVSSIPLMDQVRGDEIVVVDSAHCITPTIKSDYIFFSFHPVKPLCMANGGMLSTDDEEAHEFFKKYRNFGRIPQGFNSYDIGADGFNFYMNNLNAAIGLGQIKEAQNNVLKRKRNFEMITSSLRSPHDIEFTKHDQLSSYYLATLKLPTMVKMDSNQFRKLLSSKGVQTSYHYPALHMTSRFAREPESKNPKLPITEKYYNRFLNIPIHQDLTSEEVSYIISMMPKSASGFDSYNYGNL